MSGKSYLPTTPPAPVVEADPRATLTDAEREMYAAVLEHFSVPTYTLPGVENGELLEEEKFWLSCECLLRYLRAVKWKSSNAAIERLEATLKWRREYGLYDLVTASHVEPEAVTGKEILFGFDMKNRPGFYMFPSRQNTDEPTRQIQFAVWMLERCIDLMGPGVETIDLLINYGDKSKGGPAFSVARTVLSILQDHYPERLGLALIINVPFLLNAFYKLINPFIDPVSREKMRFNPQVVKDSIFTPEMVMADAWGGSSEFEYVHDKYWPALVELCESRKETWMKKWKEEGGKVGIKEWKYKCGGELTSKSTEVDEKVVVEDVVTVETSEAVTN
ncbi:CRAL-TRIO domain-containing protein [Collybia nuda]|uniref:CRAL-TRIO domain-containing protein n=1 Tax=Collybia nuda TaxID=64659 RepID=A0A9P5YHR2_9AGAR|nr:CRAL-TRIO domain-containing protein [Collybia nuda]